MSSECNHIKLAIRNDKSEVVCAMCKQCLITANHDLCVLNYVNGMQSANVSKTANQKKHKPQVKKPKKVGSKERLASPKPSKPRMCLRWSPTGRSFDLRGKIIESIDSECKSDSSNGDNACTSNPQEPTSNDFQIPLLFLASYPNLFMFLGTVRFGNDHVAAILGFGDLQWGNILITRVYFVEGLGHNLFSVGQFCDSDLEQGKSKRASHPPKPVPKSKQRLHLLHMDLCGPMRIASINGKRYVLVIVDDYSRYTWVLFLRSKDEAPEEIKTFLKKITVLLQALVIIQLLLCATLKTAPSFTVDLTKHHTSLLMAEKLNISFLYVFGALCYPKNDSEDIKNLGAKGDIGFFIGHSANSCAYRVYNRRI
ncbi:retrovirus-related pol polyprotein from transposon TNT 1-94 [Tanacetum coccineum]